MKKILHFIRHLGINETQTHTEKRSIILLNEITLVILLIEIAMYPEFLFTGKFLEVSVIFFIQIITVIPLLFNNFNRTETAKWYFNVVLTIAITAVIMAHGSELRGDFCFLVFAITAIIFFQKFTHRLFQYTFIISCYFFSIYYTNHYPAILAKNVSNWTSSAAFLATLISIIVIIYRFINDSEIYEKELKETLQDLKAEQKITAFQNERLAEANEELERFAYISSHNLKTPIRTIRSFTDLIERNMKKGNTEDFDEYFAFIKQGTAQMQLLITDILEFSKFNQQNDFEITTIDLNQVIYYIHKQIQSFTDKAIELEVDELPIIQSNQTFINSIFQNLIENAIKYNRSEIIKIKILYQEKDNQHQFSLTDNGIGIEAIYHEKIFGMFERLHNNSKYEGTGIGLAMTKKMIGKLNGQIRLESSIGKGSTFFISLPKL